MNPKDAAILSAVYTEWKMVKTRNSLVLCFEVPLEQQALVQSVLGTPLPGEATHVAICRLNAAGGAPKPQEALPAPREYKLAAQAAMLCNKPAFWRYLEEKGDGIFRVSNADEAAEWLRINCAVPSRAQLDTDNAAGAKFMDLRADYRLWLAGVEA